LRDVVSIVFVSLKFDTLRRAVISAWLRRTRHAGLSACALLAVLCAVNLAGCARDSTERGAASTGTKTTSVLGRSVSRTAIPLPDPALLEPAAAPDCVFRGTMSNPATVEQTRAKLDYEAQCYRQAEVIVRARLQRLLSSVDKTIRAVKRREPSNS